VTTPAAPARAVLTKIVAMTRVRHSRVDAAGGGPAANVSLPHVDDNDRVVWSIEASC
jgi:hypothetical protein